MTTVLAALDALFHPRSIAVVGAGSNPAGFGSRNLRLIRQFGFPGPMYAVNRRSEPCEGAPGFQRVVDIPGPVDLCYIAVPAQDVPAVAADCAAHGVPVAQIFTSGFAEIGEAGVEIGRQVLAAADGRTRLVGPNCIGTFSPAVYVSFVRDADPTPGRVAIASQSGGLTVEMILQARQRGLRLSKAVSIGNCLDLQTSDFLEYFEQDPEVDVIGLYLEGPHDGERLPVALRRAIRKKPVAILKGGRTGQGAASAAAHTAALAGDHGVWRATISQAGAVEAGSIDQLLALLTGLQPLFPPMEGKGVALAGNGGGVTVLASDALAESGLEVAQLDQATLSSLDQVAMPPGSSIGNPTDISAGVLEKVGAEKLGLVMKLLLGDPDVSALIVHFNLLLFLNYADPQRFASGIITALEGVAGSRKPVFVVLRATPLARAESVREQVLAACGQLGFPCFRNVDEAVHTLAALCRRSLAASDRSEE